MSSNSTLDVDAGNPNVREESVPTTTTSVLDKNRSLFGNSSAVQSTQVREATPDMNESAASETSVATEKAELSGDPSLKIDEKKERVNLMKKEKPADVNTSSAPVSSDQVKEAEISCEKKIISMDTESIDDTQETKSVGTQEENKDGEGNMVKGVDPNFGSRERETIEGDQLKIAEERVVLQNDDDEEEKEKKDEAKNQDEEGPEEEIEEEEEEEVPKKKAKRTASISDEEDDDKMDDRSVDACSSEHVGSLYIDSDPLSLSEQSEPRKSQAEDDGESSVQNVPTSVTRESLSHLPEDQIEQNVNDDEEKSTSDERSVRDEADVEHSNRASSNPETADKVNNDSTVSETHDETLVTDHESTSSSRSSRSKRATTTATPKRGRGRQVKPENDVSTEDKIETPLRLGRSRVPKKQEDQSAKGKAVENEKEEEASGSPRKGRSRRSVAANEDTDEVAEETAEVETPSKDTPNNGGRGRRSVVASSVSATPRSARVKGRKSQASEETNEETAEQRVETNVAEPSRTPRAIRSTANPETETEGNADPPAENIEVVTSSRRSTRARATTTKSTPATPVVANKRTPASGRKKEVFITEEAIDEDDAPIETPPTKKTRNSKSASSSSKKKDEHDPYDLDTEMEHHPEPLKNIHMEVQNFGAVRYAKTGHTESKYSMTEKNAESRIADLQSTPSAKNRRSLADMTPGKNKPKARISTGTGGRKPRAKKEDSSQNDVDIKDVIQNEDSEIPTSSNRGRKRKSEGSELQPPSTKRDQNISLKDLDSEEQLKVDHPQDDNEPHAPGARVYAIYQKLFYPAVIAAERDGLGRYKIQFTSDKVVKDVPNSGIIPLRALVPGKTAIYDEADVRLDATINDISAEEWAKGKVTITSLNDDGEPTEETKIVNWKEISFELGEWRDYIRNLEQNATAVVKSNITTISEAHRARKPAILPQLGKSRSRKKKGTDVVSHREVSASPVDDDDDKLLPMKEDAVGKNIFSGKIFMLTSANRSSSANVPSMFKKKNLMNFITENGGIVTEQLNSFQERHGDYEPLLISDTYYRTHKYLAALAQKIPCVSNIWLQICGEKGECVDYTDYILPAGASIFDDSQDMPAPTNPSVLLEGTVIYVHSTHSVREVTQTGPGGTFTEIWKPILQLLGAKVVECDWRSLSESNLKFDVALVDGTFREEVMEYADSINASKVTSEWIIQTIILGKAPEPTAHSKFDPYRLHHRTRH